MRPLPLRLRLALVETAVLAALLLLQPTDRRAGMLFHYSLLYLALLFVAMAVDFAA